MPLQRKRIREGQNLPSIREPSLRCGWGMRCSAALRTRELLLGLTMSLTGTAFAAPTDQAQDIDSRIAALEQQQSNLEKEIKELRHQNSQLKNQTRSQKK